MPKRGNQHVAGKLDLASVRDLTLAIDVLRVHGHTKRGATKKVARLFAEKDIPP
jgi:hypothetical protein